MIYLNEEFFSPESLKISGDDRGFLLGDGLFETMRSYQGRVFCLQEHWQRLKNSADYLEIPFAMSCVELAKIVAELLKKNNLSDQAASLRLTVTRGSGPRGLLPPQVVKPTIMLAAFPLADLSATVTACVVDIRRNELSPLARIKSLNYLDNILAKMAAVKAGFNEAILLNCQGHVAEASAANIFLVTQQNQLITPRIEDGALPGVTRQIVINLAKQLNIAVQEKIVLLDDLMNAKEIFLTNSLIEIQPIHQLRNKIMDTNIPGLVTSALQSAYRIICYREI